MEIRFRSLSREQDDDTEHAMWVRQNMFGRELELQYERGERGGVCSSINSSSLSLGGTPMQSPRGAVQMSADPIALAVAMDVIDNLVTAAIVRAGAEAKACAEAQAEA